MNKNDHLEDTPKALLDIKTRKQWTESDRFYDQFQKNLFQNLDKTAQPTLTLQIFKSYFAYAASFILVLAAIFTLYYFQPDANIEENIASTEWVLEDMTISDYYDELSTSDLALDEEFEIEF